ncbi:T9SS type B sorting domain-containing protein [Flavobacterium lacisediminis]|uniref:T9SS type B sorting domain-containing protein n=1 Tax=Flavobacterium lacisediminis TaxID=2989705 RepID=A0ABT3EJR7_9FLAO|nr:T9SS type B sorting domain-containing protein [Flavobacterium lacisediminis]MCW1148818.1 T9SS type B sorting domain-containing protein [Flavobacterium lacisediminis]
MLQLKAPQIKLLLVFLLTVLFSNLTVGQVVINEVMAKPSGNQGLINFGGTIGKEYIELYNKSCSAIDISGYFIGCRQDVLGAPTGGSFRIPNGTLIPSNGHLVIGTNLSSTDAASIDIQITSFTSNYCQNNASRNFLLANTDGWVALYNASGTPIDAVYWATNSSNISQSSDFGGNPCIPAGSPASVTTLQSAIQINTNFPGMLKYVGANPTNDLTFSRNPDGGATWQSLAAPTINHATGGANANCNFGTCVTIAAPPAPTVTTPVNYCLGVSAIPLVATPSPGGTLNWYGTNATGGTASSTAPTPSTSTAGSITYYVSQTVGGCESPRAPIVVTITSGGNLGLFCDTANSTPTSLAFDFSNVGQTNFSISYSINGGAPINVTHTSPSNYTVAGLTAGDSVTFTLTANGVSCVQPQTVTCSTASADCGSCSAPTCPIIGVANYGVRNFPAGSCSSWSPALTNTVVKNYYLVQADANGFVGLIQQANGSPALCISRSAILRPLSTSCNVASNVNPSVSNANGVASGFNPEWYGLTPNAQYIIEVTITLGAGCTLSSLCSNYYGCTNPSAPTASATIQPTCTTPTGTIVISSPTGVGNLYSIDGINFQASPTFSGLVPNTYSVIVRKTPTGCTSSATNITINTIPTITAPMASATVQPTCSVGTGTIVVSSPTGANFEYSINGTTFQSSPTFSGLTPNSYNVIVKNLTTGCISTATIVTINSQPTTPNVPTITSVAATCSAAGSSTVSNYSASNTYTFAPAGPSVGALGVISGMIVGTSYTVTATNGGCTSVASASFSNAAQLLTPTVPTITSVAATCSAAGSSTVSNYSASNTYTFVPAGPSVGALGVISGMIVGTSYTVTATNGGCTSVASASFSNAAQLLTPVVPSITSVAATCSAAGSSTVSNYSTSNTYTFVPAGPSVGALGVISGMIVGTSYTVTATNGGCTSVASASFSNAAQLLTPVVPSITSVAATCSAAGSSTVSNYSTSNTYTFAPAGPTVGAGGVILGMTVGTSYTLTATNGGCTSVASASFSNAAQLTVPATPIISSVAPTCSLAGSSSITNYVAGITYVFTPSGPSVAVGGTISGMVIGTNYTVSASNGSCLSSASASFSNAAQLTVPATPIISSVAATCSAAGSSSISNYVAGITYVFNPAGPIVSGTGAISGMINGTSYSVTASNGSCTSSASASFSNGLQLTVPVTPLVSSVPASCSAAGSSSISNYVAGITYVFNPAGPSVAVGGTISGMVIGTNYIVSASNGSCTSSSSTSFSNAAQLSVPVTPLVSSIPASCSASGSSSISNYVAGITYVFNPSGPSVAVGGAISGMVLGTNYTVFASNGSCTSPVSSPFSNINLVVPTIIASNLNPTFCSGGTTNIQLTSNVPGAIFSWTVTGGNVVGASGGTGNSINQVLTVSTGTTSTVEVIYTIIAEANGCAGNPIQIRVQVNPIPDLTVASSTAPICSGETTNISFTGTIPGTVFSWVVTNVTGVAGASNGTGTSIQQVLTTTGLSQGSVTYQITPTFNGCIGTPQSVTVLVNPRPELFTNPTHPPLCSGVLPTNIFLSSFNSGTVFNWTINAVGVDGASAGSAPGPTYTIIQNLTTSVDNVAGYVDYIITPTSAGCSGTPITVRVYVNPLPKPVLTDGAICVDEFGVPFQYYTLDSGLDNATYDFVWYFNGVAIPNSNNATYSANTVGTYGVIATNSITNCVSSDIATMVTANVTSVTPAVSMTVTQSEYFSGNATLTVNVTGGSGTLLYSLDEGTLQSSNVFTNVSSGPHTITVVDTQGCTYLVQTVFVINYPQYFTPNGDGYNDTWFIAGLQDTDVIYIFDRYGKLIKQLRGIEKWDGTYNQEHLPSTDYWFTVDYLDNGVKKQFKAHFAMKR